MGEKGEEVLEFLGAGVVLVPPAMLLAGKM